MVPGLPYNRKPIFDPKKLARAPKDALETIMQKCTVELQRIDNRAKLPEYASPEGQAELRGQVAWINEILKQITASLDHKAEGFIFELLLEE